MKDSFISACMTYFGLKADQTKLQFGKEMQALSDSDRKEIYVGLSKNGIECMEPLIRANALVIPITSAKTGAFDDAPVVA